MDWLVLAGAAAEAVSQVLVVVACGVILSRTGFLSQPAQKAISRVNLYFMTPCLLFTKIASTISWSQFTAFWPIPVFFLLFSLVAVIVSTIGSKVLGFSEDEENFVKASVLFSNTNSLPMALLQSLALSAAGSRLLRDENDTQEDAAARGISYILFFGIFGNLLRWSYGFALLVPSDTPVPLTSPPFESLQVEPTGPREGILIDVDVDGPLPTLSSASSTRTVARPYRDDESDQDDGPRAHPLPGTSYFGNVTKSLGQHPTDHLPLSPTITSRTPPFHRHSVRPQRSTMALLKHKVAEAFKSLREVLTPPLLTAILALIIGLVPFLHQHIMSPQSKIYSFIVRPIENCGSAAIPMILLCLGAQVANFSTSTSITLGPGGRPGSSQQRQSAGTPSGISDAYGHQQDQTSSSDEMEEDSEHESQGWMRVRRNLRSSSGYGRGILASSRSNASSSVTLHHFQPSVENPEDEDEGDSPDAELPLMGSSPRGTSSASAWIVAWASLWTLPAYSGRYRFKRMTPVAFSLLARMVLVPLICLPAMLFHPASLSPILTTDPTFTLTLILLGSAPTAINMIQLCQIKGYFEDEMAGVLFWSYCLFGIPCVLGWTLIGLWASGR